jgi:predicted aspartyl protease
MRTHLTMLAASIGLLITTNSNCSAFDLSQEEKQYIFYLSKKYPQLIPSWRHIVPDRYKHYKWIYDLDGTTGLTKLIILHSKPFFVGYVCMPHNCYGNNVVYLLSIDGSESYGTLQSVYLSASNTLFGSPRADVTRVLSYVISDPVSVSNAETETFHRIPPELTDPVTNSPSGGSKQIPEPRSAPNPTDQLTIPLISQGGTFLVPVLINGVITLNFTIDSGASDVSVPADVVLTLLRTGTITDADFRGTQKYRMADGSTVPSQQFMIRSLKVGDRTLNDVTGSIAPVEGSLLLGQSFLHRFKSWSIDNQREALILN